MLLLLVAPAAAQGPPEAIEVAIDGVVVDEGGDPVPGATVRALSWTGPRSTETDEAGGFRLSVRAWAGRGVSAALLAEGPGGRLGFLGVSREEADEVEPARVVLGPARETAVLVTDGDGNPVADAEMLMLIYAIPILEGRTDPDGRWTARSPAGVESWSLLARKTGVGFDYDAAAPAFRMGGTPEPEHRPLPDALALRLDGAWTLRVRVEDREGEPIAGVPVGPSYLQKTDKRTNVSLSGLDAYEAETGADGIAVLDWLPTRLDGGLFVQARADSLYAADHPMISPGQKPAEPLTIRMLPFERLSGRMTHADGRPAEGIAVVAWGQGAGDASSQLTARSDADGRFELKANAEQAYIVAVQDDEWAAPYRDDVVVRAGRPVDGVDFVLGPATRLHGRVTVGEGSAPVPDTSINAVIDAGRIPEELRREDDRSYRSVSMHLWDRTDADGRFTFRLGPGKYRLQGPPRTEPIDLTIPIEDQPDELVRDFHMERPEVGPFAARVVGPDGEPVAGALVNGQYASHHARHWFQEMTADADGRLAAERSLDPLVLHARSADGSLAGVARVDAEAAEARIVVAPLATASGVLLDPEGAPVADRELPFGIRVYLGEPRNSAFSDSFGGKTTTDADGRFAIDGLVVGEEYHVSLKLDERSSRNATTVTPERPGPLDLGTITVDPKPSEPYVPPTPAERTATAFAARGEASPRDRLADLLPEARREYTRPLLLLGRPDDPACIELYRLFYEGPAPVDQGDERATPTPAELRWEFELATFDSGQGPVRELAEVLGIEAGDGRPPTLVALDDEGEPIESFALELGDDGQLDADGLASFLATHRFPTRNAEQMLADALRRAKSGDKRVFFIASASWCGPCRRLSKALAGFKEELDRHYVFVKLDVSRDTHGDAVRDRLQGDRDGGVPWFAILDADGRELASSNMPEPSPSYGTTNIGFPSEPGAIVHFLGMLETTAPRLPANRLADLKRAIEGG